MDFQALIQNDVTPTVAAAADASRDQTPAPLSLVQSQTVAPVVAEKGRGTLKQRTRPQSLYLEIPVYELLREIAHVERKSMHSLFLEGIDAVLKKRGSPSIKELLSAKLKPVLGS